MKTMFDPQVRAGLQHRVALLTQDKKARWGKMNVYQMTKHCNIWNEWVLGKGRYANHIYKQSLLGKIFGRWALSNNTRDDKLIDKNMPAGKAFLAKDKEGDIAAQKTLWIQFIDAYEHFSNDRFVHDFFGRMSREQIGIFAYKHFDHHLRQFGV